MQGSPVPAARRQQQAARQRVLAPWGPALTLPWVIGATSHGHRARAQCSSAIGAPCASQLPGGLQVGEACAPASWLGLSPVLILLRLQLGDDRA